MADDINTAINSGGYVIVPEKAVDGTGKDAIYVYMTYNSNGNQAWKISGGLNGGMMDKIGAIQDLAQVYALNVHNGKIANDIFASRILPALGKVFTAFGVFLTFADLMENCSLELAVPLTASIASLSYVLSSLSVTLAGGLLISLPIAIILSLTLSLILVPLIVGELVGLAKQYCRWAG